MTITNSDIIRANGLGVDLRGDLVPTPAERQLGIENELLRRALARREREIRRWRSWCIVSSASALAVAGWLFLGR